MPSFHFEARNRDGERVEGNLVAGSMQEVLSILRAREEFPIDVRVAVVRTSQWRKLSLRLAASTREIADLCFHMASMISAGLSLHETMGILASRTRSKVLAATLHRITEDIEQGNTVAGAFRRYRYAFGDLLISVLKAGENSGKLDVVLEEYSQQLEAQAKLTSELRSALIYPAVLVVMSTASVIFLTGWILPQFVEHLTMMDVEIPIITRVMMGISTWMRSNGLVLLGVVLLGSTGMVLAPRYRGPRRLLHGLVLRIPLLGSLVRRRSAARFANTFSLLHASGVPLLETLELCAEGMGNMLMEEDIREVSRNVENGSSLHEAMAQARHLPPDLARIILVGEQTGRLSEMLSRIGNSYDAEVRRMYQRLVTLVEPALILVLGAVVGFVALSLVIPMLRATKSLQG